MTYEEISGKLLCQRYHSEPNNLVSLGSRLCSTILLEVFLINAFETELLRLDEAGVVWGPVHSSVGQEAVAASVMAALTQKDMITGSHRAHHQFLSKALDYVLDRDWDPLQEELPERAREVVFKTLSEILGLEPGFCGGRGGSMHLRWSEAGNMGTNAIVGGGIPLATGLAYAQKYRGSGRVVACFFGDGAVNQGSFHEALNLAGLWDLPVLYIIENNQYAVGTRYDNACAIEELCVHSGSYSMSGGQVQANDVAATYTAVKEATDAMRNGGGPFLLEIICYRHFHHKGGTPGSAYRYREREEEVEWLAKDCINTFPQQLLGAGVLKGPQIERLRTMAHGVVEEAVERCTEKSSNGKFSIKSELWPKPETVCYGLHSDHNELMKLPYREREHFTEFGEIKYSDAIAAVTGRWLEKNPEILVFGEDVASFGGGPYGATKGLPERFPRQLINTPISEAGFAGLSFGTAVCGMPTIFELMYPDFCLVAADQLFNQIGKARYMYGGTTDLPIVCRTRIATGTGFGGQHSMDPIGLFALFSGWRIVAPSDCFDYIGLFNTAMHCMDPVLILEHHSLYGKKLATPVGDLDYCIPFGVARVVCEGNKVTVLSYGVMTGRLQNLRTELEDEGVSMELIDLRTLDLLSVDFVTIEKSVKKTGVFAVVEEAASGQGLGRRLAAEVTERCFDYLDGPPVCLASRDLPNPVSKRLEEAAMIQDSQVLHGIIAAAKRRPL